MNTSDETETSELVGRPRAWTEKPHTNSNFLGNGRVKAARFGMIHSKSGKDMRGRVENNLYQMMQKREIRKSEKREGKLVRDLGDDSSDSMNSIFYSSFFKLFFRNNIFILDLQIFKLSELKCIVHNIID